MITLTTGVPGTGKSLYTIQFVKALAESEKRPVFYHGIKDLTLDWQLMDDPRGWDDLPTGAIIVIDECQTVFRPRASGSSVPPYIAAMETHRHKGYDLFLITQHPMLLDGNIRRLVGRHWHVVRKFGMDRCTVHEWGSTHEITQRNLAQALRKEFKFSPEHYANYKSSELHTHKKRLPARVYFLFASPLIVVALLWFAWHKISAPQPLPAQAKAVKVDSRMGGPAKGGGDQVEYLSQFVPRVQNMPWSAPIYDEVTKPVEAPRPTACVENHGADTCKCFDQQGNRMTIDAAMCRNIVQHGIFIPWIASAGSSVPRDRAQSKEAKPQGESGGS